MIFCVMVASVTGTPRMVAMQTAIRLLRQGCWPLGVNEVLDDRDAAKVMAAAWASTDPPRPAGGETASPDGDAGRETAGGGGR
jgi:hypothetical protein